ncbi:MAG: transcription antitermination factor NusB [Bacilli bacterium]|jgi:N utilization substance protein B
MKNKPNRRKERELALWGIFQEDFNLDGKNEQIDGFIEDFPAEEMQEELRDVDGSYAKEVIAAFNTNRQEIDSRISHYLKKDWDLSRLPKAEKSVMRLAVTELYFVSHPVPKEIAINEAVELTKKYGEEDGRRYVNGILNRMVKEIPQVNLVDPGKEKAAKKKQKALSQKAAQAQTAAGTVKEQADADVSAEAPVQAAAAETVPTGETPVIDAGDTQAVDTRTGDSQSDDAPASTAETSETDEA